MAAYSMIGIPTVSSTISLVCELLLAAIIMGFALYDLHHKRVPNKALALSFPFFLAAPFFTDMAQTPAQNISVLLESLFGAAVGFGVLLTAALLSRAGAYEILGILLIASLLCIPAAVISRGAKPGQELSLPFVPFLAIGCLAVTVIHILS